MFSPGLSVHGAIGRTPADIALMLSVQAGYDPRCPNSIRQDPAGFAGPLERDFRGVRIAWGGFRRPDPFDRRAGNLPRGAAAFEDVGCLVDEAVPEFDIEQVWNDWGVLRAFTVSANLRPWSRIPRIGR